MGTCFCQIGGYKEHFACFRCRKMFRQRPYRELPEHNRPKTVADYKTNCPDCGEPMRNMGRDFKPPARGQIKRWRELEAHYLQKQRCAAMLQYRRNLAATAEKG